MPSATEEDREAMRSLFGSIDDTVIVKELEQRKFTLRKDWCWQRSRSPSPFEWKLIIFLIDEWDYGGYVED